MWHPGFYLKTNAGIISCTENYPSICFLEESKTSYFFRDLLTFSYSSYLRQSQGFVGNSTSLLQIYGNHTSTLQSWNCSVQPKYVCLDLRIYECGSIILQYVVWYFGTAVVCFVKVHIIWEGHKFLRNLRIRKILWLSQNILTLQQST